MIQTVYLLTWNADKLKAAKIVFEKYWINVESLKPDEPEIQWKTSLDISKHMALSMCKKHNKVVIREDHALYIDGILWWNFPWPYTAYYDKLCSAEDFLNLFYKDENDPMKYWYFELGACYADPSWLIIESTHRVDIQVSKKIIGTEGNINKLLMMKWSDKTFSVADTSEYIDQWLANYEFIASKIVNG